jgi:hypothetical protein
MHHRNPRPFPHDLTRAKRILAARAESPDMGLVIEGATAAELVGEAISIRDLSARQHAHESSRNLSAFAATEMFAHELVGWLTWLARERGTKPPSPSRYDLLFTTRTLFAEAWRGRQAIEDLGIPIAFYVECAARYLAERNIRRQPRISQLFAPDVVTHVMGAWARGGGNANEPTRDS